MKNPQVNNTNRMHKQQIRWLKEPKTNPANLARLTNPQAGKGKENCPEQKLRLSQLIFRYSNFYLCKGFFFFILVSSQASTAIYAGDVTQWCYHSMEFCTDIHQLNHKQDLFYGIKYVLNTTNTARKIV